MAQKQIALMATVSLLLRNQLACIRSLHITAITLTCTLKLREPVRELLKWSDNPALQIYVVDQGHWQHHACNETRKRGGPGTLATPSQTIDAIGGPGALATPSQI